MGPDPKFCEIGGLPLNTEELEKELANKDEVWIVHDSAVSNKRPRGAEAKRSYKSISVGSGWPAVIQTKSFGLSSFLHAPELSTLALEAVGRAFSLSEALINEVRRVQDGQFVYRSDAPIWITAGDRVISTGGSYLRRGMELDDLNAFRVRETS